MWWGGFNTRADALLNFFIMPWCSTKGMGILSVAKHRNGSTGRIYYSYNPSMNHITAFPVPWRRRALPASTFLTWKLVKLPFFVTKKALSEAVYYGSSILTPMFTCNFYVKPHALWYIFLKDNLCERYCPSLKNKLPPHSSNRFKAAEYQISFGQLCIVTNKLLNDYGKRKKL